MDRMRIVGGKALHGVIQAGGSKNAALPILISSLLAPGKSTFLRVPELQDIRTILKILQYMGVENHWDREAKRVELNAATIHTKVAPYDLVRTMRASVVVLGPLLARFGEAKVSLPGGCAIGARPIDFHLTGLEKLGAQIELAGGYVIAKAKRLRGARVAFEFPSVGATQNVMMAATLAQGESVLENCAREPEIVDLAHALRAMGAELEGEGTETIRVQGKDELHPCQHAIMGDRIEAGTFLAAGLATDGDVTVTGLAPEHLEAVSARFEECGAKIFRAPDSIRLVSQGRPKAIDLTTTPYPGFPTDMQAQLMAVLMLAQGTSVVTETIFENRFMHIPELCRLGADIKIKGRVATITGVDHLVGAPLMATDLRASASLIIGGLCAKGETQISRIYHLDRGYERMEEKLTQLGAQIERIL